MKATLTYIAELVALAIILWLVWRKVVPLIKPMIDKQRALIDEQMAESERAKVELAEAEAEYEQAIERSRQQAAQIRENARADAQRTEEEQRVRAEEESVRIVGRGQEQLVNERSAIVRELRTEIGAMAVELSEQVVDRYLADEAAARASVDALLGELEQKAAAGSTASVTARGNA
jgi:F-type H+-transporting ATPase subunit b